MPNYNPEQLVTEIEHDVPYEIKLVRGNILNMLRDAGVVLPPGNSGVIVEFIVPGGGNWSHMGVDIDKDNPIRVRWTIRKSFTPKEEPSK